RLRRVRLRVADEPDRPTLDPAGRVDALDVLAVGVEDAALGVGDDTATVVERHVRELGPEVADRPVDGLDGPVVELARALDGAVALERGALGAQPDDLAVLAEDLRGRVEEVQVQATRRGVR